MAGEIGIDFDAVFKNIDAIVKHIADLGAQLGEGEGATEPATVEFIRDLRSTGSFLKSNAALAKKNLARTADALQGVVADFTGAGEAVDEGTLQLLTQLEALSGPVNHAQGGATKPSGTIA